MKVYGARLLTATAAMKENSMPPIIVKGFRQTDRIEPVYGIDGGVDIVFVLAHIVASK